MLWRIISLLIIIFFLLLSMALVLGFALGIGWLLTLFLPFSLFEATLLAIITSIVVGTFWYNLINPNFPLGPVDDMYDEDEDYYDDIPANRFYKSEADKTWETWLRYHLANSIYYEFQESPQPVAAMGSQQLQELAIRLADISVDILKTKTSRTKRLNITTNTLKKQLNKIGQRPYDDDILDHAAEAVNEELFYHHDELLRVVQTKRWKQPYDGYEFEGEFF